MEKRGKQVLEHAKPLLAQVVCLGADGQPMGSMSGLFYLGGGHDPLVLTVAHVIGWAGAVRYLATFNGEDGAPATFGAVEGGRSPPRRV